MVVAKISCVPDSYPVAFRRRKRGDAEDLGKEMRGAQRVMGRTDSEKVATGTFGCKICCFCSFLAGISISRFFVSNSWEKSII